MFTKFLSALFLVMILPCLRCAVAAEIDPTKAPYNIVSDGSVDCTAALNQALSDAAKAVPKEDVYLPPGIYAHSDQIKVDDVELRGAGNTTTILRSTNPNSSAINLTGDGPVLRDLQVDCPSAIRRLDCGWQTAVTVYASNFRVTGINIGAPGVTGSPSAGIICLGASQGQISGNTVYRSLADGIHMTSVSHDIVVEHNTVLNSGDDMIAVVSYLNNKAMCHDITIRNNNCLGQTWGRGITVIGGTNIVIDNNRVENSKACGIHLASESSYKTFGPVNISITNNSLKNCDTAEKDGHGSIFVYGNELAQNGVDTLFAADHIEIVGNTIEASHNAAIRLGDYTSNVVIKNNTIDGAELNGIGLNIWAHANDPNGPRDVSVTGNTIAHTASPAILQGPGLQGKIVIENNKTDDNSGTTAAIGPSGALNGSAS